MTSIVSKGFIARSSGGVVPICLLSRFLQGGNIPCQPVPSRPIPSHLIPSRLKSLLAALLGDLKYVSGDIYAAGALAYVPQTAWIPNDTVRNNVLFGKPYDEAKYEEVLTVCRLRRDLEVRHGRTCVVFV